MKQEKIHITRMLDNHNCRKIVLQLHKRAEIYLNPLRLIVSFAKPTGQDSSKNENSDDNTLTKEKKNMLDFQFHFSYQETNL